MNTEESWKNYNPNIAVTTIKKHIANNNVLNKFDTIDEKKTHIETRKSPYSRETMAVSLIEFEKLKGNDVTELEQWSLQFKKQREKYAEEKIKEDIGITEQQMLDRIDNLRKEYQRAKHWIDAQNLLVGLLYLHHPLRNVYRTVKKSNYDTENDNYINSDYVIHLNNYKNMKKKGEYIEKITNQEIKDLIDTIKTDNIIVKRHKSHNDEIMQERAYIKMIKQLIGVSSTPARKLGISTFSEQLTPEVINGIKVLENCAKKFDNSGSVIAKHYYNEKVWKNKYKNPETEQQKKANDLRYKLFSKT